MESKKDVSKDELKIYSVTGMWDVQKARAIIIPLFEDQCEKGSKRTLGSYEKRVQELIEVAGFKGTAYSTAWAPTYGDQPAETVLLVGCGDRKKFVDDLWRGAAGTAARFLQDHSVDTALLLVTPEVARVIDGDHARAVQLTVEGVRLGIYRFDQYKAKPIEPLKRLTSLGVIFTERLDRKAFQTGLDRGLAYSRGTILARDLVSHPSNVCTPAYLAAEALRIAKTYADAGITCEVLEKKDCEKLKMGAFLSVAQGSATDEPPKFIVLEYGKKKKGIPTVCLVGKGITFDTGGISLKPAAGMDSMKWDMGGAAAVIGAFEALGTLKPVDIHVVGITPATPNMPSGSAYKPGDIVTAMNGKTIEVLNTDAEGRMILADALAYAERYKPDAIVDLATLTGAAFIALGPEYICMMSNSEDVRKRLGRGSKASGEKMWELPLPEAYEDLIKSPIAELQNIGKPVGGMNAAGTIIGGMFLQHFGGYAPWAHLDIAARAWAYADEPYCPKGGRGAGVRLLLDTLETWAPAV